MVAFINPRLVAGHWPTLSKAIGRVIRDVWESAFPELAEGAPARLVKMNDLRRRLLRDVLEVGNDLPLVITGGYAVQAHGIVDRLSRDIDVATNSSIPMEILASQLIAGTTLSQDVARRQARSTRWDGRPAQDGHRPPA